MLGSAMIDEGRAVSGYVGEWKKWAIRAAQGWGTGAKGS
jgi:hypothetical protein